MIPISTGHDLKAQQAVESGKQLSAAANRFAALDAPSGSLDDSTRKAANAEFARYAKSMGVRNV